MLNDYYRWRCPTKKRVPYLPQVLLRFFLLISKAKVRLRRRGIWHTLALLVSPLSFSNKVSSADPPATLFCSPFSILLGSFRLFYQWQTRRYNRGLVSARGWWWNGRKQDLALHYRLFLYLCPSLYCSTTYSRMVPSMVPCFNSSE